ncbi:MAG: DUF4440 domain-containing protein [Bacteroidota bacterium]
MSTATTSHEAAIRAARARSNAAIARHDVPAILAELDAACHVTAGNGGFVQGHEALGRALMGQFAQAPDARYVRTPDVIEVAADGEVAFERGTWVATWTGPHGPVRMEGPYAAAWRHGPQGWKARTEIFVTLRARPSSS